MGKWIKFTINCQKSGIQYLRSVQKTICFCFFILTLSSYIYALDRPKGLMVDLLEKTDVVWRDGFPTQLSLSELPTAIERLQIAEVASSRPSFSWIVSSEARNTYQSAWQIQLSDSLNAFETELTSSGTKKALLWDSGKKIDSNSTSVQYGAEQCLQNSTTYYWRVRIWDQNDQVSDWSMVKSFRTATNCEDFKISRYPIVKKLESPKTSSSINERTFFYDFGRAAFGQVLLQIEAPQNMIVSVRLGERIKEGRVDRKPSGSTRYWEYKLNLLSGIHTYSIKTRIDTRNSSGAAVLMPDYIGEVMPFRYVEIELPSNENMDKSILSVSNLIEKDKIIVQREMTSYPFDENAAFFHCNNESLNKVWELCRYSIEATSFAGIYVDGDRERIPYEGDALLNQLSHYSVDREYSLARYSQEYMLFHPTWPTEWNLQTVQMAWYDYLYTGDDRYIKRYYEDLKFKSLTALAEENGLISTKKGKLTDDVLDSIHFKGTGFRDIVDWPHKGLAGNDNAESGETDGFEFNDFNVVVNSYYFFALNSMKKFAEILEKEEDVSFFNEQIDKVKHSFQEVFFDSDRGIYCDGEVTRHASLHGNMFPLAFGLVPSEHIRSVTDFVESRGMRCSVYGAQFLLEGTYEGENGSYGLTRLIADDLRGWLNMLRVGSTITLEAWDDRYKPNQDWNHAWGAAPANIIPRKVVGVEPLLPGCASLRIKPQIANLTEVEAKVPTVRGNVELIIRQEFESDTGISKSYNMTVSIPGNVRTDVYIPAIADEDELRLDGQIIANDNLKFERVGNFWKIMDIGSGTWNFERIAK